MSCGLLCLSGRAVMRSCWRGAVVLAADVGLDGYGGGYHMCGWLTPPASQLLQTRSLRKHAGTSVRRKLAGSMLLPTKSLSHCKATPLQPGCEVPPHAAVALLQRSGTCIGMPADKENWRGHTVEVAAFKVAGTMPRTTGTICCRGVLGPEGTAGAAWVPMLLVCKHTFVSGLPTVEDNVTSSREECLVTQPSNNHVQPSTATGHLTLAQDQGQG
jgi:hypothetical protein